MSLTGYSWWFTRLFRMLRLAHFIDWHKEILYFTFTKHKTSFVFLLKLRILTCSYKERFLSLLENNCRSNPPVDVLLHNIPLVLISL